MNPHRKKRRKAEPTIALINVVFLMLIFFLVAGTVAPPLDPDLTLANTRDLDGRAPPDALVLLADGRTLYRGQAISEETYVEAHVLSEEDKRVARLVPDRSVPAIRLVEVTMALRAAGADAVYVVTERGLE